MKRFVAPVLALLAVMSGQAAAQATSSVGYTPSSSPYLDLEYGQEFTIFAGQYHAHRDPVNIGPQSGLNLGARYAWRPIPALNLIAAVSEVNSNRRLINPAKPAVARELGTVNRPLWATDLDLGLNLTGGRSWHHIVPELAAGAGLVSDLHSAADSGGYKFGTRFAFNYGGGLRIVPGGRWSIRADMTNRAYTMSYPESFYTAPVGGTAVLKSTQAKSFWTNNPAYTLGLSYLF